MAKTQLVQNRTILSKDAAIKRLETVVNPRYDFKAIGFKSACILQRDFEFYEFVSIWDSVVTDKLANNQILVLKIS